MTTSLSLVMTSNIEGSLKLRTVCNELEEVKHKAYEIGIQLGVPHSKMMLFKQEGNMLSAAINFWLCGNVQDDDIPVAWSSIVAALKSKQVGEIGLAAAICKKYCGCQENEVAEIGYTQDEKPPTSSSSSLSDNMSSLDSDIEADLEQILHRSYKEILIQYADYVDCILTIVEEKGVTVERLSTYLLNLPAFTDVTHKEAVLSDMRAELENAGSVIRIFNILGSKYASFLDYDIFEIILKKYGSNESRESLDYPKHLEKYVKKHKIIEFIKINPKLKKSNDTSTKVNIKLNLKKTQNLHSIKEVKEAVANILDLQPSTVRILSVKKGCIQVTLLIPASIADVLFQRGMKLTAKQQQKFREASVLWIECNDFNMDFREDKSQHHFIASAQTSFGSFPYLENVPGEERRQLEARLRKESGNMINAFAMLVDRVNQSLKKQGVTGDDLRLLIKNLRCTVVYKALRKQLRNSLDEVMNKLGDYWSFFDYEVLKLIIDSHCRDLYGDLTQYEEEFKNYCRRPLCEIPEGTLGVKAKCEEHLYLKCDKNFSYRKSSLWNIKVLKDKLSELLETKLVLLSSVHQGCVELKIFCFSDVPYPLTRQQSQKIKEVGIIEMCIEPKRNGVHKVWILRLTELMVQLGDELEEMTCKELKEISDIDDEDCSEFLNQKIMEIAGQILRPSQILDYLYLGSRINAKHIDELENGVDYILNCSRYTFIKPHHRKKYLKILLLGCSEDMAIDEWNKGHSFLKESKASGSKAMVYCSNGMEESAATVVAYVMKEYKMSLENALSLVKSKRKIVYLRAEMIEKLKCYERSIEGQLELMDDPNAELTYQARQWAFDKLIKYQNLNIISSKRPAPSPIPLSAVIDKKRNLQNFFASLPGASPAEHEHMEDGAAYKENYMGKQIDAEGTHSLEDDMRSLGGGSVGSGRSRASSIHSIGSTFSAA